MRWGDESLSGVFLAGYLGLLTLLYAGMTAGVGAWHRRNALPTVPERRLPRLTICVPARDEAHQIAACVRAALDQDHPDVEVVVVDDGSTDGTADVARAVAPDDPRLRVVRGAPPPAGWAGKPWACQRAAAEATGEHLLFIDADVVLGATAAARAAGVLVERQLGLLSLFGTWTLESFWERVAIPVIGWFIRGATDVQAVNTPSRREAFANGQFILVERASYEAIGGHSLVRAEVLDDVRLARAAKQRGVPIALYAARDAFRVRLYRSLGEIVRGYTKNLYEGMDRRPLLALGALLFLFVGSGLPPVMLVILLVRPTILLGGLEHGAAWAVWIVLVNLLPIGFRWRIERADGRSGAWAWTHPIGNLVLGWVLIRAMLSVESQWKGRRFVDGRSA